MSDFTLVCLCWLCDWESPSDVPYHLDSKVYSFYKRISNFTGKNGKESSRHYDPSWVVKLVDMVRKNTTLSFDTVCITNQPQSAFPDHITAYHPKVMYPAWWMLIDAFKKDFPSQERMLYLDLDCVICNSLDPIIEFPTDFAILRRWPKKSQREIQSIQNKLMKRIGLHIFTGDNYNTSVMVMNRDCRPQVYDKFDPKTINYYHGEQDWISECLPGEKVFPSTWFRKITITDGIHGLKIADPVKVLWSHPVKNQDFEKEGYVWADKVWKGLDV